MLPMVSRVHVVVQVPLHTFHLVLILQQLQFNLLYHLACILTITTTHTLEIRQIFQERLHRTLTQTS